MPIVAKLDEFGRPAWILLIVLGFMAWWPAGLAIARLCVSGADACGCRSGTAASEEPLAAKDGRGRSREERTACTGGSRPGEPPASGNHAFDEYRSETLRRLEDEQREFQDFLARLRMAKDKSEFDQFMAERRSRSNHGPSAAKLISVFECRWNAVRREHRGGRFPLLRRHVIPGSRFARPGMTVGPPGIEASAVLSPPHSRKIKFAFCKYFPWRTYPRTPLAAWQVQTGPSEGASRGVVKRDRRAVAAHGCNTHTQRAEVQAAVSRCHELASRVSLVATP